MHLIVDSGEMLQLENIPVIKIQVPLGEGIDLSTGHRHQLHKSQK